MPSRRLLTDTYIRAAERVAEARRNNGRSETPDLECSRMRLRVTDKGKDGKGHKSFVYLARFPGSNNPTRRWLGDYPEMSLEKAREKARIWGELIRQGIDPADEERRKREAEMRKAQAASANTFAARVPQ
jgi:hypothetical protein